ncbi:PilZ domain-containing protein [Bacillus sp. FJAT-29937]|uniref:PilZ domain-containing protein n=1 Tax=Bacillus sp. FJAT-29937 TaxID=1720553 RepID=UPI00082F45CF|nr:PilZ domain-containing protein [Bacillus sp. FJAT-29937]
MKIQGIFKRQEGFRLAFNQPIPATFTILQIQGKKVDSNIGEIHILDMSLKGAKIMSQLRLPIPNTKIKMECVIADEPVHITGELIWEKKSYQGFMYGMAFNPVTYSEQQLLQELKKYVIKNKTS